MAMKPNQTKQDEMWITHAHSMGDRVRVPCGATHSLRPIDRQGPASNNRELPIMQEERKSQIGTDVPLS